MAAENPIVPAFVRRWKISRALYRQYGGRIIYQQSGPEPLDAYHRFLKVQEAAGAFGILRKEFAPAFWKNYAADSLHSFCPAGSREKARPFDTPPWHTTGSRD